MHNGTQSRRVRPVTELTQLSGPTGSSGETGHATPPQVLVITCAGVGAGQPRPVHRQRGPSADRPGPQGPEAGRAVLGAERVRHRLRVAAGVLWTPRRPSPRDRAFLLGVAIFTVVSAACAASTTSGCSSGSVSYRRRGGPPHADIARLGPRLIRTRSQARRRPGLDCSRWHVRRRWPGCRRTAGGCQLALGLPGQRPGRDHRPHRRMAPAPPYLR